MLSILMDTATLLRREKRRLMTRRATHKPGEPLSPEVATYIASYAPVWPKADLKLWNGALGDAVRAWVSYVGPVSTSAARHMLTYSSGLTLWVYKTHRTLKPAEVWQPNMVEHWTSQVMHKKSKAWKATAFSRLASIGPLVAPKAGWPTPKEEIGRRNASEPYSVEDEWTYLEQAWEVDPDYRSRALFMVAAGFGAGLDGRWLAKVTAADVRVGDDAIVITVSDSDGTREIPLREAYREAMLEALATSTTTYLIGTNPDQRNKVHDTLGLIRPAGLGYLKARRMRNTWLVRLLQADVSVPYLLRLAGLASVHLVVEMAARIQVVNESAETRKALSA